MRRLCENCSWFGFDPLLIAYDHKFEHYTEGVPGICMLDGEVVSPKNNCDLHQYDEKERRK